MKVILLSDTHGYLDPGIFPHLEASDEIWHAGDIGDAAVTDTLQKIKPLRAVFGNIDDKELQARLPEDLWFTCEGLSVWITHIGGAPPRYNPRVKKILKEKRPDLFICGHSHILKVMKDESLNMLYINPGAAGSQGFHQMKTIIRMELSGGKISKLEVVELGKRGAIQKTD